MIYPVDSTERMNKFQKRAHRGEQAKASKDALELPIGERLTRFRSGSTGVDDDGPVGPWKRREAQLESQKPAPTVIPEAAPKTQMGLREDPTLTAAREAEQARRGAATKTAAARQPEMASEDKIAIFESAIARHISAGDYYSNEFNGLNWIRCVDSQIRNGVEGWAWNTACFELAFQWLSEHGYFELPPTQRRRALNKSGEAAKIFPEYVVPSSQSQGNLVTKTLTVMTREENRALRTTDFDELQKTARAEYKPVQDVITYLGKGRK